MCCGMPVSLNQGGDGRDVSAESVHSISVIGSITCCLMDIVFLRTENSASS